MGMIVVMVVVMMVVVIVMMMLVVMIVVMMLVIVMHGVYLREFFFYYTCRYAPCQTADSQKLWPFRKHFWPVFYPPYGLAPEKKMEYNKSNYGEKGGFGMEEHLHTHAHIHSHGHVHANQKAVVNRLARAIGHLEKVKRMVEEGYDCSEVLVQLAAVRSAIDNTGKVILQDHMRHCMVDAVAAGDTEAIDELCLAIDKYMK